MSDTPPVVSMHALQWGQHVTVEVPVEVRAVHPDGAIVRTRAGTTIRVPAAGSVWRLTEEPREYHRSRSRRARAWWYRMIHRLPGETLKRPVEYQREGGSPDGWVM